MSSARRVFLVTFVVSWALATAWSAASPPFSGPDETAHALRAYSAGKGQVVGRDGGEIQGIIGETTRVDVPRSLGDLTTRVDCFAFQPQAVATCASDVVVGRGTAEYIDTSGRTPPAYHLVVSPPLLVSPHLSGLYLARLIGSGITAALVAGAVAVAWARGLRATVLGAFLACTPMAWFMAGVLNPSGLEIAGGIALWVAGAAILHDWEADRPTGRGALVLLAASGASLALARSLGPLWVALFGGTLAVLSVIAGTHARAWRDRGLQVAAGVIAAACSANLLWIKLVGTLENDTVFADGTFRANLAHSFGRQFGMWRSMFANFGYLDTVPPEGVHVAWAAAWVAVGLIAVSIVRRWERWVVLALVAAAVLVPAVIEASQWNNLGPVWQGRYTLPILAGVPILSGWILDRHRSALPSLPSLATGLVVIVTAAHAVAYWFAIRRYAVGTYGPVWFLGADRTWLGWKLVPVTLGGLVVVGAAGAWATLLVRGRVDPAAE